mmetsp:Transcript_9764/g.25568  ORF Transcript_9764/g.25568 Transcript_9764/m.25568 type:complete len:377 (-) Transcript_9764:497-1627(-)
MVATFLAISVNVLNGLLSFSGRLMSSSFLSSKTKQDSRATVTSGVSSLKLPLKMSSVTTSSSAVLISHAVRPFCPMIFSSSMKPRRRRTRVYFFSSSFKMIPCPTLTMCLMALISLSTCMRWLYASSKSVKSIPPSSHSFGKGWPDMRSSRTSTLRMIFFKSLSSTLRSSKGSSSGGPSGKRLQTSLTDFPTTARFSRARISFGTKSLIADIPSSIWSEHGTTLHSKLSAAAPRFAGTGLSLLLPASTHNKISTLYFSPSAPFFTLLRFKKLMITPHPKSSASPSSRTRARRPGCRNGVTWFARCVMSRICLRRSSAARRRLAYSLTRGSSAGSAMASRRACSAASFFWCVGSARSAWNCAREREMTYSGSASSAR